MELNYILVWMVAAASGLQAIAVWMQVRFRQPAWFIVLAFVGAVLAVASAIAPGYEGIVAAPIWALLVLVPGLCSARLRRLLNEQKYRQAELVARILGLLHPFGPTQLAHLQCRAIGSIHHGNLDRARGALHKLEEGGPLVHWARALRLRIDQDWTGIRSWIDGLDREEAKRVLAQPEARISYLRALGEQGDIDQLVAFHARMSRQYPSPPAAQATEQLMVLVFAGSVRGATDLLDTVAAWQDPVSRELALATAEIATGDESAAEARLDALDVSDPGIARRVEDRRSSGLARVDPDTWTVTTIDAIAQLEEIAATAKARGLVIKRMTAPRPWSTWAIAGVLTAMFIAEIPGGTTNLDNLYDLGMLVVPLELTGNQYWRVFTAGLLHYGGIHFVLNVVALLLFGRQLEGLWGHARMAICFVVANVMGVLAVALLAEASADAPVTLVGASGGVMGVLGALAAQLLRVYRIRRTRTLRVQLTLLVLVLAVQVVFDMSTPMVSQQAHLAGLATGVILGALLRPKKR